MNALTGDRLTDDPNALVTTVAATVADYERFLQGLAGTFWPTHYYHTHAIGGVERISTTMYRLHFTDGGTMVQSGARRLTLGLPVTRGEPS